MEASSDLVQMGLISEHDVQNGITSDQGSDVMSIYVKEDSLMPPSWKRC
jgi:hypothetical protein